MSAPSPARCVVPNPKHRAYLDSYDVDRRSISITNLTKHTKELDLQGVFEKYGPIHEIQVQRTIIGYESKFFYSDSVPI